MNVIRLISLKTMMEKDFGSKTKCNNTISNTIIDIYLSKNI